MSRPRARMHVVYGQDRAGPDGRELRHLRRRTFSCGALPTASSVGAWPVSCICERQRLPAKACWQQRRERNGGSLSDPGVLDFPDASWLIPLHRSERRLFVVRRGKTYYDPMRATQDSCRVPLTWSRCVTLSLPKADFRTRVTWTSSVFQIKQGTADRVTKITTEFRRLNAVPIRDLRSDEGKYTAVANCIVTRGRFLSRCGQP